MCEHLEPIARLAGIDIQAASTNDMPAIKTLSQDDVLRCLTAVVSRYEPQWSWNVAECSQAKTTAKLVSYLNRMELGYLARSGKDLQPSSKRLPQLMDALHTKLVEKHGAGVFRAPRRSRKTSISITSNQLPRVSSPLRTAAAPPSAARRSPRLAVKAAARAQGQSISNASRRQSSSLASSTKPARPPPSYDQALAQSPRRNHSGPSANDAGSTVTETSAEHAAAEKDQNALDNPFAASKKLARTPPKGEGCKDTSRSIPVIDGGTDLPSEPAIADSRKESKPVQDFNGSSKNEAATSSEPSEREATCMQQRTSQTDSRQPCTSRASEAKSPRSRKKADDGFNPFAARRSLARTPPRMDSQSTRTNQTEAEESSGVRLAQSLTHKETSLSGPSPKGKQPSVAANKRRQSMKQPFPSTGTDSLLADPFTTRASLQRTPPRSDDVAVAAGDDGQMPSCEAAAPKASDSNPCNTETDVCSHAPSGSSSNRCVENVTPGDVSTAHIEDEQETSVEFGLTDEDKAFMEYLGVQSLPPKDEVDPTVQTPEYMQNSADDDDVSHPHEDDISIGAFADSLQDKHNLSGSTAHTSHALSVYSVDQHGSIVEDDQQPCTLERAPQEGDENVDMAGNQVYQQIVERTKLYKERCDALEEVRRTLQELNL